MLFSYRRTSAIFSGLLLQSLAEPSLAEIAILPAMAQSITQSRTASAICPSQLSTTINSIIDRPELKRFRWGIVVKTLNGTNLLLN
jgi:serine-type D-Ala-D-Ala carboxypeptidase/endopeptidase (penicillin-binding protein 4)